jgi:Zn-dependent M28 family amino/carboxypeptidase
VNDSLTKEELTLLSPRIRPWRVLAVVTFVLALPVAGLWWLTMMPGKSYQGPLAALTKQQEEIKTGLLAHVYTLAEQVGERNMYTPGKLDEAGQYITEQLESWGYEVETHAYEHKKQTLRNLFVEIPGADLEGEIVIVGGHYDSVEGSPGANDNGSGVAVTLELARLLEDAKPKRTLRFLFFVNEEPPYFQTGAMGSRRYARACKKKGENVVAMLAMETMGYYDDAPGTQDFPLPFLGLLYPHTGNFIGFVGNISSRKLVRESIGGFRRSASFPSRAIAAPEFIPGIGWSDHWSFWQEGYPALMVTDTAPFRDPNYHHATDLPKNIDYGRLARVTDGLTAVVRELARVP